MRLWTGNNRTIFPIGVFKEKFLETQTLSCLSGRRQVKTFVICLTDCCLTWSTRQTRHLFHFIMPLSTFVIPSHQRWLTCWALFEQTWNKKSIFYLCKLGSWLNILHNADPDNNNNEAKITKARLYVFTCTQLCQTQGRCHSDPECWQSPPHWQTVC